VFNARGDLFIHLRTPTKDVNPSCWDVTVGGVPAAGEDFDAGAARELLEELGVTAELERLFPIRYADQRTVVHGMVYRTRHEGPFRFQPEEVVCGEFVKEQELDERIARDPFCADGLAVLAEYRERINKNQISAFRS
jgi:isopentenyldiphosphate isomerase